MNERQLVILCVEDDPGFQMAMENILREQFPDSLIIMAQNAQEVLDNLSGRPIDAAAIGLGCDGLDGRYSPIAGLEIIKEVKKRFPDIPCVAMSAYAPKDAVEFCRNRGTPLLDKASKTFRTELVVALSSLFPMPNPAAKEAPRLTFWKAAPG